MERIPYGPLGPAWLGHEFQMVLEAAVEFQRAARKVEPRHLAAMELDRLRQWLVVGRPREYPGLTWAVWQHLDEDFAWVTSVCASEICHGDPLVGSDSRPVVHRRLLLGDRTLRY